MTVLYAFRKALRATRRLVEKASTRLMELPHRFSKPERGTAQWLVRHEVVYGGLVDNVPRRKVSPLDDRTPEQLAFGGMTGGDRMLHHGYAPLYAHFLAPFLTDESLVVAEFGILQGTGLALWCDLFPDSRVVGLDIDLSHFEANRSALVRRGAFGRNHPELHEYDQLLANQDVLDEILRGRRLDIVIDDGLHSLKSILMTWRSVKPHLSSRFIYFIEDYENLLDACGDEFAQFHCYSQGLLTVIKPRCGGTTR